MVLALNSALMIGQRSSHWTTWVASKRLSLGRPVAMMDLVHPELDPVYGTRRRAQPPPAGAWATPKVRGSAIL